MQIKPLYLQLLFAAFLNTAAAGAESAEILIDGVVASVNGKPIMFSEAAARIGAAAPRTLQAASADPAFQEALEGLILERLIEEDARAKRVSASESDINRYAAEVARRNSLSLDEFKTALAKQGTGWELYQEKARLDILRSKIAGQILRSGITVTDQEVLAAIDADPRLSGAGTKVKLSRLIIRKAGRTPEEVNERIAAARELFAQGEEFARIAEQLSDGPEAAAGGSLGVVPESELSAEIHDALVLVDEGELSGVVENAEASALYLVENRFQQEDDPAPELIEEVRGMLQEQKLEKKMYTYFSNELPGLYTVEKLL